MFKNLFILLFQIVFHPSSEWKKLSRQFDQGTIQRHSYLFPIICIISLCSLTKTWIEGENTINIQLILKIIFKQIFVYGGGFCLAVLVISKYLFPSFQLKENKQVINQFTAYSFAAIFISTILELLLPSLFLLKFCTVYTVFIIWNGTIEFLKIDAKKSIRFAFLTSLPIIFSPMLIRFLIEILIPGMKI